jgi:hypothetical protein
MERHAAGQARAIPVILRPCEWQHAPFGKLLATPKDGKPVTKWADPDEAFLDIAKAIRAAAPKEDRRSTAHSEPKAARRMEEHAGPRSSNIRLRKTFTERDRDQFLDEFTSLIDNGSVKGDSQADIDISCRALDAPFYRPAPARAVCESGPHRETCEITGASDSAAETLGQFDLTLPTPATPPVRRTSIGDSQNRAGTRHLPQESS